MFRTIRPLDRLVAVLALTIFAGVVVHAPLSVWLGVQLPDYSLVVKAWKEVLLAVAAILLAVSLTRHRAWGIYRSWLWYLVAAYIAAHIVVLPFFDIPRTAVMAGLLIDLRFVVFLGVVYGLVARYPALRRPLLASFFVGAGVVVLFGVLQVTVLPHDILASIGYSASTIAPFLTVDQNMDYIRINSTLRGPNPLGAYAAIVLALTTALLLWRRVRGWLKTSAAGLLALGAAVVLWFSYSRSALVGAALAVAGVVLLRYGRQIPRWLMIVALSGALATGLAGYALRDTQFVSQVILHEDPLEGNEVNSNDGHADSLADGVRRLLSQPFGAGVGSTGSASLHGDESVIIENHYLFVAHEAGWVGLAAFMALLGVLGWKLWQRRTDWLAVAVLTSGIGLCVVGLLLPVWADDTVSLVWWGLAAVALLARPKNAL